MPVGGAVRYLVAGEADMGADPADARVQVFPGPEGLVDASFKARPRWIAVSQV